LWKKWAFRGSKEKIGKAKTLIKWAFSHGNVQKPDVFGLHHKECFLAPILTLGKKQERRFRQVLSSTIDKFLES
jgi:hypothetical protein